MGRGIEQRPPGGKAKPFSFRRFLRKYHPTLLLCSIGAASFTAGLVQQVGRDVFAGVLVVIGVGSFAAGAFASRILQVEIGTSGMKASLRDDDDVEETARFLSGDDPPPEELEAESEGVVAARTALAGEAIAALLQPKEGPLSLARLRLYLYDENARLLVPVKVGDDDTSSPLDSFEVGAGATGEAYASGQYVLVTGEAVSDETYNLTPAQRVHFRDLTAVAAAPVTNASGEKIGVLTASTREPIDPSHLMEQDAFYDMLSRSMVLARVLVDLLGWFDDGAESGYSG